MSSRTASAGAALLAMFGLTPVFAQPIVTSRPPTQSYLEALCQELAGAAAWAENWQCVQTGVFADNPVPRKPVISLRERAEAGEQLDPGEQAILAAAPQVGVINFCGKRRGNAFLVRHDGRPAVVTSGHMLTELSGQFICPLAVLRNSTYLPNVSYFDDRFPDRDKNFVLREVDLIFPPVNLQAAQAVDPLLADDVRYKDLMERDFIAFYLAEDITKDVMPDGTVRGYIERAIAAPERGNNAVLMGMHTDMFNEQVMTYQHSCRYDIYEFEVRHTCDALSSGSMVGMFDGTQFTLLGLYQEPLAQFLDTETPTDPGRWNTTLHAAAFLDSEAQLAPRPDLLAFDIQFELKQAGCYRSTLDNLWGPSSQDALSHYTSATGVIFKGLEPTQAIFDLLRENRADAPVC